MTSKIGPKGQPARGEDDPLRIVHAEFLAAATSEANLPAPVCTEIAFAGRSNVGKSSLINALVERKNLVRTSSTPGSTRQIHIYEARALDKTVLHLVDLPGYGFTRRSKSEMASWAHLVEGYIRERASLAAILVLCDVRRGLEDDDRELIDFVERARSASQRPVRLILVATKLDKLPRSSQRVTVERLCKTTGRPLIGFSAMTGEGRKPLWSAIRKVALGSAVPPPSPASDSSPPAKEEKG